MYTGQLDNVGDQIEHGITKCDLLSQCIHVPINTTIANQVVDPSCVVLKRCIGVCCEHPMNRCAPISYKRVQINVF
jgi:hypothetical protein